MVLFAIFLTASAMPGQSFAMKMVWLCLAGAASFAYPPSFWVLPTMTLSAGAAAASIGMINSIGNFSGFVSPTIVGSLKDVGYSHAQLVPYLSLCTILAAGFVAALRVPPASAHLGEDVVPEIKLE
jgi:hypothetical protein